MGTEYLNSDLPAPECVCRIEGAGAGPEVLGPVV